MKVLVTGGAGYVGAHCVRLLLDRGIETAVVDNFSTGHRQALGAGARLYDGDLRDRAFVERTLAEVRPQVVMHLASKALVGESMRDPFGYFEDNLVAALNLIRAAVAQGAGKFIFSSTANLFAAAGEGPIREDSAVEAGSPYGESKHLVERMLHWADRIHGLRVACLRFFNAAGAHPSGEIGEDHEPETHLIPLVLRVAQGRSPAIRIFGDDYPTPDGTCIRDYVHVCDLAEAHLRVIERLDRGSCAFNLGTGRGHSVLEVIRAAERVTGRTIAREVVARRPGDPAILVASPDRFIAEVGWQPRYRDLEALLETAWNWHRRR